MPTHIQLEGLAHTLGSGLGPYMGQPFFGNLTVVGMTPNEHDLSGKKIPAIHRLDTDQAFQLHYRRVLGKYVNAYVVGSSDGKRITYVDFPGVSSVNSDVDTLIENVLKLPNIIRDERLTDLIAEAQRKTLGGESIDTAMADIDVFAKEHPDYGPVHHELIVYRRILEEMKSGNFARKVHEAFKQFDNPQRQLQSTETPTP